MNKIIILTNYKNLIPQREKEIDGLKLDIISKVFEDNGFEVEEMKISSFISNLKKNEDINGVYFYYTSSQYQNYKSFIRDILIQITLRGGVLLPEYRHFSAHENKNFQELEKKRLGIPSPYGIPIGTYEEGVEILNKISYPVVIKKSTGFASRNVRIASNLPKAKKILLKMLDNNFKFDIDSLYYFYRRVKSKAHYPKRFGKVVIQEYIPDLTYDWKILVLGNTCFYLKRYVRKNDFRASGSGSFTISEPPPNYVLDFALWCKEKLESPNISLDIIDRKGDPQLIEYQANHFGVCPAAWGKYYFKLENGNWNKKKIADELEFNELEHYIGIGICDYIKKLEELQYFLAKDPNSNLN